MTPTELRNTWRALGMLRALDNSKPPLPEAKRRRVAHQICELMGVATIDEARTLLRPTSAKHQMPTPRWSKDVTAKEAKKKQKRRMRMPVEESSEEERVFRSCYYRHVSGGLPGLGRRR